MRSPPVRGATVKKNNDHNANSKKGMIAKTTAMMTTTGVNINASCDRSQWGRHVEGALARWCVPAFSGPSSPASRLLALLAFPPSDAVWARLFGHQGPWPCDGLGLGEAAAPSPERRAAKRKDIAPAGAAPPPEGGGIAK